uniref:hypothetical protein n=1 Tax=Enterocloster clostridioformis TaxID=1531 RepID=UPI0025A6052E|nr:hypothetical protein [Enterocloster clostridioformis]
MKERAKGSTRHSAEQGCLSGTGLGRTAICGDGSQHQTEGDGTLQNTKTEYDSTERMPVILPEMEQLLPPLSGEQFSSLESDILENGCYAPIIVSEDMTVIDGHNRFRICEKHNLPFTMLVFSFADLLEAKQWALDTQKGRRNLDKWELGQIALKLKPEIEARARANQGTPHRPFGEFTERLLAYGHPQGNGSGRWHRGAGHGQDRAIG